MTAKRIIVMSGISGVGKSTYIRETFKHVWCPMTGTGDRIAYEHRYGAIVVSADHHFMHGLGNYRFDPTQLQDAHCHCFRMFVDAIQTNANCVIVDNTNTTAAEIAPYMLAAQAYAHKDAELISLLTDNVRTVDTCTKDNKHGVPTTAAWRQFDNMQKRQLPTYWNHTEMVSDNQKGWILK